MSGDDPLAPARPRFDSMEEAAAVARDVVQRWDAIETDIQPNFPDWLRSWADEDCKRLETRYNIERNPLDAWEAYRTMRIVGGDIPEWVLLYFDESAANLERLESEVHRHRTGRNIGAAVAKAMGMKKPGRSGASNAFTNHQESNWDWVRYALKVQQHLAIARQSRPEVNPKVMFAVEAVAKEEGVSESTVWRAWRQAERHMKQGTVTKSPTS